MLPSAAASGTGTTILTDAAGDNTGGGPGADIVRLGGLNDDSAIHFYVGVADKVFPAKTDFFVYFHTGSTGTGSQATGCDWQAFIVVDTTGTITTSDIESVYPTPAGGVPGPDARLCFSNAVDAGTGLKSEDAKWVGNEIEFTLPRADIFGIATTDTPITSLSVESWDDSSSTTNFDRTSVAASYSNANTAPVVTVPGAPLGLAATATTSSVSLSWNAPASDGGAAITGYKVYRDASLLATLTSATPRAYVDSTISAGTTYSYQVSAVNAQGEGAKSAAVSVTPAAPTVPGAPLGLAASGSDHVVQLGWSAPASDGNSPITSYNVYRGTQLTPAALVGSATSESFADADVVNGETYFYYVTAVNAIGEGAASGTVTATPKVTMGFVDSHAPLGLHSGLRGDETTATKEPSVGWYNATKEAAYMSFTATFWAKKVGNAIVWRDGSADASKINGDPILFTDRTTGRTWAGGLENDQVVGVAGMCSQLSVSDDGGATWTPTSVPCDASIDHETVGSGPYHAGTNKPPTSPVATLNRVVYYCSQLGVSSPAAATPSIACSTSVDGGMTFGEQNTVQGSCAFLHGHVKVGPDGTAVVPDSHCGTRQGYFTTVDNGLTWTSVEIPGTTARGTQDGFDPSMAWGNDGSLWWAGGSAGDNQPIVSVSTNNGATWSAPVNVAQASGLSLVATTFHVAVAGDAGRMAVAYLGTATGSGNPFKAPFHGVWDLYVSYTYDGGATWQTEKVSADPVQRGHIWDAGGTDTQRNLLDFMDATLDEKGNVVVGYSDGCVDTCATSAGTEAQSISSWAAMAWQTTGRPLFSAYDNTMTPPSAPQAFSAVGSAGQVSLSWAAPASNGGSPILGYTLYKGTSPGALTTTIARSTTSYLDTSVADGTTYYYVVTARNALGESAPSPVMSATPHVITPPTAPQAFIAQAGDGRVTLVWTAPASDGNSAITSYHVYRGTAPGAESQLTSLGNALSFVDVGVANGATYYYTVAAENAAGIGASTGEQSAKPLPAFAAMGFDVTQPPITQPLRSAAAPLFGISDVSKAAAEPTIGWYDGTKVLNAQTAAGVTNPIKGVLYQAFADTLQLTRDPVTGQYVWTTVTAPDQQLNIDPYLFTDRVTGRTWSGGMEGNLAGVGATAAFCNYFDVSDDGGKTWTPANIPCATGQDHESIASGAFHAPLPNGVLPGQRVTYLCNQLSVSVSGKIPIGCTASWDGGLTWQQQSTVLGSCIYIHGHIRIDEGDGTAYVPDNNCGTHQGVFLTEDNGVTWNSFEIPGTKNRGTTGQGFDPAVAISPDHTVYFFGANVGATGNHAPFVAISKDHARTWTAPVDIAAASGVHFYATTFQKAVAGDNGRVAVAYLGTTVGSGNPVNDCATCVWDLYVTITYDGGQTWETHKVTTDPVQRGWIYSVGSGSGSGQRNLLDFMDVSMDDKGHVIVGYADGCVAECALPTGTPSQSHSAYVSVAWQTTGRGLLAAYDVPATVPGVPTLIVSPLDQGAKLSWSTPSDGGQTITGYGVYRDGVPIATVQGNAFTDAGLTNGQTYAYAVSAQNVLGSGALSQTKSVVPALDTQAPDGLTGVHATRASDNVVSLAWNPGSDDVGVDHYRVTRDGVVVGSPAGVAFTDSGLRDGRFYTYGVAAVDGAGNVGPATTLRLRPVSVPLAQFLGRDATGDQTTTNAAQDLVTAAVISDANAITFRISVADMAALGNTASDWVASFSSENVPYQFTYERNSGTNRCNAYIDGALGSAGTCETTGNEMVFTIPKTIAPYNPGDALTSIVITSQTPAGVVIDRLPDVGSFTYVLGSPASAEPPTFTDATSAASGLENATLAFTVQATHPTDEVAYAATGLPTGATFDAATGAFSWTPTFAQAGDYLVHVTADTGAATATKDIAVSIANVDRPLVLDAIDDKSATEGLPLAFTVHATDPDGGSIIYGVDPSMGLPVGASLNPSTGIFRWTPNAAQGGNLVPGYKVYFVKITAKNGPSSDAQVVKITVANVDRSPILGALTDQTGPEGSTLKTTIAFADPDLDPVQLTVSAPATLRVTGPGVATISYTPNAGDAGNYPIEVTATDGVKTVRATAMFHVLHHADFTAAPVAPTSFQKSPGEHVLMQAAITNHHPEQDVFVFTVAQTAAWGATPPSPVAVPSGGTAIVTLEIVVPADGAWNDVVLSASSVNDGTQHQNATYHVVVPVLPEVAPLKFVSASGGDAGGVVLAKHLDGTPAAGARVSVKQTPQTASLLSSEVTGVTDANGKLAYTFAQDPRAKLPGIHDLVVTAGLDGAPQAATTGSYFVG